MAALPTVRAEYKEEEQDNNADENQCFNADELGSWAIDPRGGARNNSHVDFAVYVRIVPAEDSVKKGE